MKVILKAELFTYYFNVEDQGITYSVIWNRDTCSADLPEFQIVDEEGITVEDGCQVWEDIVAAIKEKWEF